MMTELPSRHCATMDIARTHTKTVTQKHLNKKLSYPQRKCASNVAILYGADGISI